LALTSGAQVSLPQLGVSFLDRGQSRIDVCQLTVAFRVSKRLVQRGAVDFRPQVPAVALDVA
jgi:hypothetical protein